MPQVSMKMFPEPPKRGVGHVLKLFVLMRKFPDLLRGRENVLNNLVKMKHICEIFGQMAKVLLFPG